MRIPWRVLNVTDPSSRRVLHREAEDDPSSGTVETGGFRIYAFAVDPSEPSRGPISRLPAAGVRAPLYTWSTWETPRYRTEPKRGIDRVRATLRAIPDEVSDAR
jgi:hypothetical protein